MAPLFSICMNVVIRKAHPSQSFPGHEESKNKNNFIFDLINSHFLRIIDV